MAVWTCLELSTLTTIYRYLYTALLMDVVCIFDRCDECMDGFWSLESFCLPCDSHCNANGTVPGSNCDKSTGQCVCEPNVQGKITPYTCV